jgi:hypothetical protein
MMTDGSPTAQDLATAFAEADALRRERRIDVALEAFVALLPALEAGDEEALLSKTYDHATTCAARLKLWDRVETLARRAIARQPALAVAHTRLGEALLSTGRREEARPALAEALALDPDDGEARVLQHLAAAPANSDRKAPRTRPWPVRQAAFEDPDDLIRRYLLRGHPADLALTKATRFVTMGSCFAHSLGKRLSNAGYGVHNEAIGEEVNSPLANRQLFEWLEHGPRGLATTTMHTLFGADMRTRLRAAVSEADVVVLTLGVAPCFFEVDSGDFVFLPNDSSAARDYLTDRCVMRTTSVAENVAAIGDILGVIARLSDGRARVVLTVSPAPLAGTNEFESAVVADCLSKSTLRLACHEALGAQAGNAAVYWPSFEIVRWLGGYFTAPTLPAFGSDDGNTRHVSKWLVKLIVRLFLEHYGTPETPAEIIPETA